MDEMDLIGQVVALIAAVTPVVAYFVVFFAKKGIQQIPRVLLPVIASAVGLGIGWLEGFITGGAWSPVEAAAWGALAVVIREVYTTLQEHGLNP